MKKRVFCLLLGLVMLFSLLPAAAFAEYSAMYHITVIGGTAAWVDFNPDDPQDQAGTNITAPAGATISLVADDFMGENFWKWEVLDGPDVMFDDATRQATVFKMPEGDLVIKAMDNRDKDEEFDISKLKIGEYELTVIGGTGERKSLLGLFDVLVELTAEDPPIGMKFKEWQVIEGSGVILKKTEPNTTLINIKDDITVQAVFVSESDEPTEDGKYTVSVIGGTSDPATAAPGESVVIMLDADKYDTFERWEVAGNNVTLANANSRNTSFTMPEEAVTVRAVCEGDDEGMYSITVTDGGYASRTRANPGDTVMLYTNNFEASNFMYWECEDDDVVFESARKAITSFIMPDHDVTIKAVSLTGKTICTYKINGGVMTAIPGLPGTSEGSTAIKSQTYTVVADAPPSGMVFDKWVLDSPAGTAVIIAPDSATTMVMCINDFEMTATYKSNGGGDTPVATDCFLVYSANGGSFGGQASQSFKAGAQVTISSVLPTRDGYTFLGWSDDASDTAPVYAAGRSYTFSETTVLYAIWQKNSDTPATGDGYQIIVIGGTADKPTAKAGELITITLDPSLASSFSKWETILGSVNLINGTSPTAYFIMPAEPVIVQAVTGGTPTDPVKPSDPDDEAIGAFVSRLYSVCLGRSAAANEIEYYEWLLTEKGETGVSTASKFVFSKEFAVKNYCDRHYVQALYNAFMGREPAENEIEYGAWRLQQGDSRVDLFNEFALSPEFAGICSQAGIQQGSAITEDALEIAESGDKIGLHQGGYCTVSGCTSHEPICEFVELLYANSLDRYPAQEEIDAWHYNFVHGDHTASSAAYFFFFSDEFISRDFNSEEYIYHLYSAMFGREPDIGELTYWVSELEENNAKREDVFTSFTLSDEFLVRCQQHNVIA